MPGCSLGSACRRPDGSRCSHRMIRTHEKRRQHRRKQHRAMRFARQPDRPERNFHPLKKRPIASKNPSTFLASHFSHDCRRRPHRAAPVPCSDRTRGISRHVARAGPGSCRRRSAAIAAEAFSTTGAHGLRRAAAGPAGGPCWKRNTSGKSKHARSIKSRTARLESHSSFSPRVSRVTSRLWPRGARPTR